MDPEQSQTKEDQAPHSQSQSQSQPLSSGSGSGSGSASASTSTSTSALTSAMATTSIDSTSSTSNSTLKPQKRVQVIGQPPVAPPNNSIVQYDSDDSDLENNIKDIPNSNSNSNGKSRAKDDVEESEEVQVDGEDDDDVKKRVKEEGDVDDEDLLATYDGTEQIIDLSHLRLTSHSLNQLNLPRFSDHLNKLCLRQNEISKFSSKNIGSLKNLKDLDLYDNQLEKTCGEVLKNCPNLESVDFSFNSIRHISSISHLSKCSVVYFVQNKISKVRAGDLDSPLADVLTSLELGGNRLRSIENIGHLHNLKELWLGKNKITKLENISTLSSLKILSIQSNRITSLKDSGLSELKNLEELYLSHNGLIKLEGLEGCFKLKTLDIGANKVEKIEGVSHLKELEEFWANDNQIPDILDLTDQLGPNRCPNLETVYLEGNPLVKVEGSSYRRKVKLALPQLSQIDATFVR